MVDPILGLEVLTGAVGVIGVAVASLRGRRRHHDPMVDLSPTAIAGAKGGPVKIVGTLKIVGEPLRAPVSGRPCAFWDVTVDEERQGAVGMPTLHVFLERRTSDFLVDDGTGPALVKCPPNAILDFALGGSTHASGTFRERALVAGQRVAVYGHGHREPDPDVAASGGSYRERPTRLVIEPLDGRLRVNNWPSVVGRP